MIPWWWSWVLAAIGVTGIWLTGSKRRMGFLLGAGAQVLWIAYALATRQYGFLVTAGAYGVVYVRGWLAWREPVGSALVNELVSKPSPGMCRHRNRQGVYDCSATARPHSDMCERHRHLSP